VTAHRLPHGCPRCGSAYEPGQEYCLDCGQPLPRRSGRFTALTGRRGGAHAPGEWVWPVLAFFLIGALGALIAIVVSNARGERGEPVVAVPPPARATTASSLPVGTAPAPATTTPGTTTESSTQPAATTPARAAPGLATWTAADGYTIVLSSAPYASGRTGLTRSARRAEAAGLPRVGILNSADYSSLHPGYFVLFSGVYASQADASADLPTAQEAGFASAYARRITR
jgi:hypothetical protein